MTSAAWRGKRIDLKALSDLGPAGDTLKEVMELEARAISNRLGEDVLYRILMYAN